MSMTQRVARLRQQSLEARPTISTERAELMTAFYRQDLGPVSAPVRRALAFQYMLEHCAIYIGEGELIVGEKGAAPKAIQVASADTINIVTEPSRLRVWPKRV